MVRNIVYSNVRFHSNCGERAGGNPDGNTIADANAPAHSDDSPTAFPDTDARGDSINADRSFDHVPARNDHPAITNACAHVTDRHTAVAAIERIAADSCSIADAPCRPTETD